MAGFTPDGVALADVFSNCLDLLSYSSVSNEFGLDNRILSTKLDVERTLLLHWAERIGLLKDTSDKQLGNDSIKLLLKQMLSGIQTLLSDEQNLQHRYGLKQINRGEAPMVEPIFSKSRIETATAHFNRLQLNRGYREYHHKEIPLVAKVLWAAHGSEKFDKPIHNLSYFITRLNTIVPHSADAITKLIRGDFDAVDKADSLQLILKAAARSEAQVANLTEEKLRRDTGNRILDLIWFRIMDDRRDAIEIAHPKTFDWALYRGLDIGYDDLSEWPASGSGISWIYGRPGCGKSTLMRHGFYHRKTQRLLKIWAGLSTFAQSSFFFWCLGTPEQRSQECLYRALLFNFLESMRCLIIPEVLPRMWKEAYGSAGRLINLPSQAEVKQTFESSLDYWTFHINGVSLSMVLTSMRAAILRPFAYFNSSREAPRPRL